MHPSGLFHQTDAAVLTDLVDRRGLALLVGIVEGRPVAVHAPVLLEDRRLRFHVSRSSALAPALAGGGPLLAVVTGPDAYISPDWYGQDDQVPTWNYLSVEAEGPVRVLDQAEAGRLIEDLSARFEAALAPKLPWTRAKMTPGRFEALLGGIIACEMTVERLEGTWKLGQNKPAEARLAVAGALEATGGEGALALSALLRAIS